MAATEKGVWDLQEVRDKQLQSEWSYDGLTAWFGMGKNYYGGLGLGTGYASWDAQGKSSPTQLPGTWSKISGNGGRGFRGLKPDGTAWAWGWNRAGQLGINISPPMLPIDTSRSSPCQIGTDTTWSSEVTNDDTSTMWIKTDNTLWSWGYNPSGQLGDDTTVQRSSPCQVGTETTWSKINLASGTAYAIKTDGTMWAWGNGRQGCLGLNESGPTFRRSSPCQVGTGTDWSDIIGTSSGAAFAQKTDGTTWSWGYDQYGKTGLNTVSVSYSSPTQLPGTWSHMTTAYSHVLGVRTDGTLWSWGYNPFGNLGLNDASGGGGTTSRSSPTQVGTATTWSQVAAGYLCSLGTKTDGTLWTWGENEGGQLGQNTPGSPSSGAISSPTQVGTGTGWSDPASTREEFYVKRIM